jgi:hypothetical protein
MKTFLEFLTEDEHTSEYSKSDHPLHDIWKHSVPALRNIYSKKIQVGKRGEAHHEMTNKVSVPHDDDPFDHWKPGFYHTKNKTFHGRDETEYMDSTDIMSPMQRDRYMERRNNE